MSQVNLTTRAAVQYSVAKIGAIAKTVKTLAQGQGAIVGAIKSDRAKTPVIARAIADEVASRAVKPLTGRFAALVERIEADKLEGELLERHRALRTELEDSRVSILAGLRENTYQREHTAIRAGYWDAVAKADKRRSDALQKLTAELSKRSLAARKVAERARTEAEYKRAFVPVDKWKKANFDKQSHAAHAARDKAEAVASAAFDLANDAAYARYVKHHKIVAKCLLDANGVLTDIFTLLAAAQVEDNVDALADLRTPGTNAMCNAALARDWNLAWDKFDSYRAGMMRNFEF